MTERHDPPQIEILPPDPGWRSPRAVATVYEAEPETPGAPPDAVREVRPAGDPRVIGRLVKLGVRIAVVGVVLLLALWLLAPAGPAPLEAITDWLREAGWLGKLLVVVAIAAGCPFLLPVGPVAIVPGYLWGPVEGTALAIAGATLGGLLNFAIARNFLRHHVRAWVESGPLTRSLYATLDARGLRLALGLRLSPIMNFGLLAYVCGLSRLEPLPFAGAMAAGGIPWTAVYGVFGGMLAASSQAVTLDGVADQPEAAALRWIGLGVTVALAVWIGRVARREIARVRQDMTQG